MLGGEDVDWQTRIGRNWRNVIGIVILDVGLVLLIQPTILPVPPIDEVLIGVGVSALLLAAGNSTASLPAW